jgi:outer membrane protein assembly factor BamD
VQEVLAQREYNIGRFYYLRQAYPAAIARLQTMVDRYPLYSGADDALYLLGQCYEGEIALLRQNPKASEAAKAALIANATKKASEAYSRIITRYPAMDRALDAKARLEALHQTVPRPTRAALELNKKETASRHEPGVMANMMGNFTKRPDTSRAATVGEPTTVDPAPVNPIDVVNQMTRTGGAGSTGENTVSVEKVNAPLGPGQEPPRSDAPPAPNPAPPAEGASPEGTSPAAVDSGNNPAGELKPNVSDPNELKPNVPADPNALPPPPQNNELANGNGPSTSASSATQSNDDLVDISSSKKKKKGLGKLNPF